MRVSSAPKGHAVTRRIAPILCVTLAACAATPESLVATSDDQRCVQEARIGSSIPTTRCYDRVVAEQHKRDTEFVVDQIRRAPTGSTSSASSGGN
jgi:hypothetical protein